MKIIFYILAAALITRLYFFFLENRNLYFPSKQVHDTPESIHLEYEDLTITTSDGERIHSWFIPGDASLPTVIYAHGNAGNMSHRLYTLEHFHTMGLNTLIFDYRGYGQSTGKPSEKGLFQDITAVYHFLIKTKKISPENIIVFGRSLGGAVAIDLGARLPVAGIISDSTFSSTIDMGRRIYPFLPVHWFISQKYDSVSKIHLINVPKLFIHSRNDDIVPFELGEKLYKAASEPKELYVLEGGHNEAVINAGKEYFDQIKMFLEKYKILKPKG